MLQGPYSLQVGSLADNGWLSKQHFVPNDSPSYNSTGHPLHNDRLSQIRKHAFCSQGDYDQKDHRTRLLAEGVQHRAGNNYTNGHWVAFAGYVASFLTFITA